MSIIKRIGFFCAFIIPAIMVAGYYLGGWWNYATIIFVFVAIPILDAWVGKDDENIPEPLISALSEELYFRIITYAWTWLQVALLFWGAYVIAFAEWQSHAVIGFVISFALCSGGIGITVAHELGHKKSALERFYAQLILMTVSYMHFYIEHNKGHHVHVATPKDPATSREGEHFYAFWLRTVVGSFAGAWRIEKERLQKKNLPVFSIQNMMLVYIALTIGFCALLMFIFSVLKQEIVWGIPLFFVVQSVLGFSLLELVNYIEHYGITRRLLASQKYEKVNESHSWNANQVVSNFFLFQLQRHSDHHAYAHKRYQVLKHIEESPQLPSGYPAMILLALVPPLWFKVMNKRLKRWQIKTGIL